MNFLHLCAYALKYAHVKCVFTDIGTNPDSCTAVLNR